MQTTTAAPAFAVTIETPISGHVRTTAPLVIDGTAWTVDGRWLVLLPDQECAGLFVALMHGATHADGATMAQHRRAWPRLRAHAQAAVLAALAGAGIDPAACDPRAAAAESFAFQNANSVAMHDDPGYRAWMADVWTRAAARQATETTAEPTPIRRGALPPSRYQVYYPAAVAA